MRKKIDIVEATDVCLKKMHGNGLFLWDAWWTKILKQALPSAGSISNFFYVRDRLVIKNRINLEFIKRGLPDRLVVQRQKGIKLLNKNEAPKNLFVSGRKKVAVCLETHTGRCYTMSEAKGLSKKNRTLMNNEVKLLEQKQETFFISETPQELKLLPDGKNIDKEIESLDVLKWAFENANLSETERDVLIWHRTEGRTFKEIGKEIGKSCERVRCIFKKANEKIQKAYQILLRKEKEKVKYDGKNKTFTNKKVSKI